MLVPAVLPVLIKINLYLCEIIISIQQNCLSCHDHVLNAWASGSLCFVCLLSRDCLIMRTTNPGRICLEWMRSHSFERATSRRHIAVESAPIQSSPPVTRDLNDNAQSCFAVSVTPGVSE